MLFNGNAIINLFIPEMAKSIVLKTGRKKK